MFQRTGGPAYKSNLNNTTEICRILGNSEKKFNSVHIAGTNGKGSVAHFVASILQEAGYKVGLFTSPHLKDFRERIRISGEMIPEEKVVQFVAKHIKPFELIKPSFFEYAFGMAVQYFAEEDVDIAVMETGMGGRLDSTNVINSIVSVITNIGYDHTQYLGNTLEKIANEKAGIIKEGIPVIIGETQSEVADIFKEKAKICNSDIYFADKEYSIQRLVKQDRDSVIQFIVYRKDEIYIDKLHVDVAGDYQNKNIVTALITIDVLKNLGYTLNEPNIRNGFINTIRNTGLQGRWQILNKKPLVICDTGHNVDGMVYVVNQIKKTPYNNLHFVLGMVNDKDIGKVLDLLSHEATYYFCKADIPRGMDQEKLKIIANGMGLNGDSYNSVIEAYNIALKNAREDDLVFVGGSTFVVAEVL